MTTFATPIERDGIEVSGPDAATFLQGQLSQDLDALAVATSTWTLVLQPDGKIHTWARLTKTAADVFLLDTDQGAGEELQQRLTRFLIRTKAEIEAVTLTGYAVRGADLPRPEIADDVLRLPAPLQAGYDLLGPGANVPEGVATADATALEIDRVERGIPRMGRELDDSVIPAEAGQWIVDESVSFTKGCYVGQELVARIDSRGGNVPRTLRAIVCDAPVAAGDEVTGEGPSTVVTSAVVSPTHGNVALAFCGRKIEPGNAVVVGSTQGIVHELPLVPVGAS
ncbi:CAF17-like 4Fe-4S cluster assembly/insertion protein YgfZ [Actinospongicola halichondriae]|uniref:CAF17-like 4Fe-4S cluster assembly/insertion protein YgfZ n=1 Tax=Actinospongicola halichondriae TaxID=3236844 RepID=UPI003D523478